MKTLLKPTFLKLFITIGGLLLVVLFLAFRLYTTAHSKPPRKPGRPAAWGVATAMPDRIVLNISGEAAGLTSVTWRTDTTVASAVAEIALADAAPRFDKKARSITARTTVMNASHVEGTESKAHYHSATFGQLLPDTTYAYRVGNGTYWSEWFHFKTSAAGSKPFSFIYLGDAQNSILENYARVLRGAYQQAPQARLVIHAGDLVHTAHSEQQWQEWFAAGGWLLATIPHMPAVGNHEYAGYTQNEHRAKKRHFSVQWPHQFTLPQNGPEGLKEMTYYYDYQGVRFVTLNSNERWKEQAAWLEGVLKNNPQQWTVVIFHHPVYSAANHDDNRELRTLWQPVLEKYSVDLVLTGHEHSYTRGQAKIKGRAAGPVYIVSVSGGNMYYFEENPWQQYNAQLQRKGENTQLYQVITVNGKQLQYRAYTAAGVLYDAFELVKEAPGKGATLHEGIKAAVAERTHGNTIAYKDKK